MQKLKNTEPFKKTVPGYGVAEPGQELPKEVPPRVAAHLLASGGWEPAGEPAAPPPTDPEEDEPEGPPPDEED
jgi:hypothetical protein